MAQPSRPSHPGRRPLRAVVGSVIALWAVGAAAADKLTPAWRNVVEEEGFSIGLGQSLVWEDNVFRLPEGSRPVDGSSRSDRISRTTLGLGFDHTYGRQHVNADFGLTQRRYDEHSGLDSTTRSGSLRWDWAAGKRWSGTAQVLQREAPRSFDDIDQRVLSINTLRRVSFDARFWLHPDWSLVAGTERTLSRYSDTQSTPSEYDENEIEAGIGFHPRSGNRLTLVARFADGKYPHRSPSAFVDSGYQQRDLRLRGNWAFTGQSRVSGYLGVTQRTYDNVSSLDFGGVTGRLVYDWFPTAKLALRAVARREIGSEYEVIDNYVVTRGVDLAATWSASAKVALRAYGSWLQRNFGNQRPSFNDNDRWRVYGVALIYEPLRVLSLSVSYQRTKRLAEDERFGYRADTVGVDARLDF